MVEEPKVEGNKTYTGFYKGLTDVEGQLFKVLKIDDQDFSIWDKKIIEVIRNAEKTGKLKVDDKCLAEYKESVKGDKTYRNVHRFVKAMVNKDNSVTKSFTAEKSYSVSPSVTETITESTEGRVGIKPTPQPKTPQSVWDLKDRRIVRQNVLNRAVDILVAEKGKEKFTWKEKDMIHIKDLAKKLEEWVYR